jgi:hypothetical protein
VSVYSILSAVYRSADTRSLRRFAFVTFITLAAAAPALVMHVAAQHTIEIVRARHLLPRWDLATHLGHGWLDYHLFVTGQIHRLLWDLWLQGYWPPGLSIYQVPFYLTLGGDMTAGLWSSPVAFVLLAVTGSVLLWRQWSYAALLPAALFIALLISSPYVLAFATVTMTETLGGLAQLLVLLCYQNYRQTPGSRTARLFAVSLTVLFFIKYNYFFMLAGPLVVHEWLERTCGWSARQRLTTVWRWTRRILSSSTGAFVALFTAGLLIVVVTGGFEFHLAGNRVSVRSIGNMGHVVLYILLARLWYLHRRGRIDWASLTAADPRIRPLLLWFAVPVTVWLASPYPNHVRDVASLVINRPLGDPIEADLATYLDVLRYEYFYSGWILIFVAATFTLAALRYRRQPPLMQWLILAVTLQFTAIALHQTRSPRFLLLTVVLLCLAAAGEVGRWSRSGWRRLAAGLLAPIVLASGVVASSYVVTDERFRAVAFGNYIESEKLRLALAAIRGELDAGDRLLIVGQSDALSPALFRWELGPPSGVPGFPFPLGGTGRLEPALATKVLLVVALDSDFAPINVASFNPARLREIREAIDRGDLRLLCDIPLADLHVALRLYGRP